MSKQQKGKTHISVWIVGGISLVWHLMGCANYLWQTTLGDDAVLSAAQSALILDRPAWVTAAFAIAVFGGAIGSILLLLRKSLALVFFVIALVGVIVSMIPAFGIVNSGVEFAASEKFMYLILTPLFGAFLVWFTRFAMRRGWVGNHLVTAAQD